MGFPFGNGGVLAIGGGSSSLPSGLTFGPTAGQGLGITAGTAITAVNAISITQTWNEASTNFTASLTNVTNTASATSTTAPTSYLEKWQVGGVTKAAIRKGGEISAGAGTLLLPGITFDDAGGNYDTGFYQIANSSWGWGRGGVYQWGIQANLITMKSTLNIGFAPDATPGSGLDTNWSRISSGISGFGTGAQGSIAGGIQLASIGLSSGHISHSATAPTIASGFGSSPSIPANNGTAAFTVNVGTGGVASSGVITMPTATTGWACTANPTGAPQAAAVTDSAPTSTTSITLTNYTVSTGIALAWPAGTVLEVICVGY